MCASIVWIDDFTFEPVIYSIVYNWYKFGVAVSLICFRYVAVSLLNWLEQCVAEIKVVFLVNSLTTKSATSVTVIVDSHSLLRKEFQNVFNLHVTLFMLNAMIQLSLSCFIVFVLAKRDTLLNTFSGFWFFILPDLIVISVAVASLDRFGAQVIELCIEYKDRFDTLYGEWVFICA